MRRQPCIRECVNFQGQPSNVEESGGTSESSPFVAGAAALVIQAYRKTHGGAFSDPGAGQADPRQHRHRPRRSRREQGAGLLNSYKAVQLAESYGTSTPTGSTLTTSETQLNAVGYPGSTQHWQFTVSNTGASPGPSTSPAGRSGPTRTCRPAASHSAMPPVRKC